MSGRPLFLSSEKKQCAGTFFGASYASIVGGRVVELPYEPRIWTEAIAGHEHDQPARCAACYLLRLGMTAAWADRS